MKNFIFATLELVLKFFAGIFCLGVILSPVRALTQVHLPFNIVMLSLFIELSINGLLAYGFWTLAKKIEKNKEIT